ncbi:MAG: DEAD/DEAH box helicase [Archangium sp.]
MESPAVPPSVTFDSFGLRAEVLSALKALGYEEPTPIQRETIPALLGGRDVLGQAATGTGKTAAFALPMLERVDPKERKPFQVQALVLVPTRELAMQVAEAVQKYGGGIGVTSLAVYGGQEIFNQIRPLKRGVDIVIATPGRALDHIERKTLLLDKVKVVVLDEADEMLDMGFEEDLQKILGELPKERQTALFSATLPSRIAKIAEKHLKNPVRVTIAARSVEAGTLPKIRQSAFIVQRKMKEAALMRVLEWETPQSAIIFCRTRTEVESLNHVLMRAGYEPAALHGGLTQEQRDQVLKRFKDGAVRVLVATDVAARGLHVENLSHVVNFDLPTSPEVYVHRIGRTGRAGKDGTALSFLDPREQRLLKNVEFQIKGKVPLAQVPTRAQLDARRSETVAKVVQNALAEEGVAQFIELAKAAAADASMEQVAGAAMLLLQRKLYPPHASDSVDFKAESRGSSSSDRGVRGGDRGSDRGSDRGERSRGGDRRGGREERSSGPREGMTALSISMGERAGIRPQDLVGAIANEANIPSRNIHGVQVGELSSRVEVPTETVHEVIKALHATRIRGRKVRVTIAGAESDERSAVPRTERPPRSERPAPPPKKAERFAPSMPEVSDDDGASDEGGEEESAPLGNKWMISDELEGELDAAAPPPSAPRAARGKSADESPRASAPRAKSGDAEEAPRASAPRGKSRDAEEEAPRASAPRGKSRDADEGDEAPRASAPRGKSRDADEGDEAPRASAPRGKARDDGEPRASAPRGKSFGDKPRFGDRGGGKSFGDRSDRGGGKSFGDRGGKSFGDKRFGDRGDRSGGKSFGDRGGDRGGKSFGEKRFGDRGDSSGGKSFGEKRFGDRGGGKSFGDKPRPGDRFGGNKKFGGGERFGARPPGTFGSEGGPPPRPSAGRFSSDKSRGEGFAPKQRFGDRPGSSNQRSGGQSAPKRREFGPPSGPGPGPARFSGPPKKKHGRMG